ncbi:MAG TPA: hypothetical protein VN767_14950 [Streptosporangiaceae bacterium]|nr:hypothetical protein [Streptosporangiaceae bacterium]
MSASHAPSPHAPASGRRVSSRSSAPPGSRSSRTPLTANPPPSSTSSPPAPAPSSSAPASQPPAPDTPSPENVVRAFIAAINAHDWPRVWQLGGKNLNSSYDQMVSGYRLTARDILTNLATSGNTVTARLLAYETTGGVQTYLVRYVVSGGIIVAGHGTLLGTSG